MNGVQIRVGDLIYAVVKRWKMLLFLTLVGCGFGLAWSGISFIQGNFTSYKVSCSVALTSQSATGAFTANSTYLTNNDFHLAEDMVDAAIYVMKSDRVLNTAIGTTGLASVEANNISNNLTIERYNETQIVEITLKWNDETTGLQLMNAILEASRQVLPETLMIGSVAVIDEPTVSHLAGGGGNLYMWPIMGAVGLLFGIGIAVLDLIMRPTLLNLKDVENVFGLETLGIIPRDDVFFQSKISLSEEDGTGSATKQNFASTAYILRNRFGAKEEPRSFYVTSTLNGEGKSVVAANLAVALADMEKHVLLLDLDTKNPSLGGMFLETVDYNRTLNSLYKGDATLQEVIVPLTGYLDLLPAVPEYNAIPLDNTLFDFVRKLEADYDYIVIDAAAVKQTSETLGLNQIAHAALFVVRYDMVPMPEIEEALNKLDKSGVRILGCVVNAEQTLHSMTIGSSGQEEAKAKSRNGKKKPVSAAMGEDSVYDVVADDDLLMKATPAGTEWSFQGTGQNRDILEELTDDPASGHGGLSDEDALDALYRMGLDGSWKNRNAKETPAPEAQPSSEPQKAEPVADTSGQKNEPESVHTEAKAEEPAKQEQEPKEPEKLDKKAEKNAEQAAASPDKAKKKWFFTRRKKK